MDIQRKRELLEAYKNRCPEMGVISFRCIATGESFLGASSDTKADFNSSSFKLSTGTHPNKQLQALWKQYGRDGFELCVLEVLKYDDPKEDHTAKLEAMRTGYLANDRLARRIWR